MFLIFMHLLISGVLCVVFLKVRKMWLIHNGRSNDATNQFFWGSIFCYAYLFIVSSKFQLFTNTVIFPDSLPDFQNLFWIPFSEWAKDLQLNAFYEFVNPNHPLRFGVSYRTVIQQSLNEMFIVLPLALLFISRDIKGYRRFAGYIGTLFVLNMFVQSFNMGTVITLSAATYVLVLCFSWIYKTFIKTHVDKYNQMIAIASVIILLILTFFTEVLSQNHFGGEPDKIAYNQTIHAADDQIQVKLGTLYLSKNYSARIDLTVEDHFYNLPYDVNRVNYSFMIKTGDLTMPHSLQIPYSSEQSKVESLYIIPYKEYSYELLPIELPIEVIKMDKVSYTINDPKLLGQLEIIREGWQSDQLYPYYEVVYRVPEHLSENISWWIYLDYEFDDRIRVWDWRVDRLSDADEAGYRYYKYAHYFMDAPKISGDIKVNLSEATYTVEF